MSDETIAIGGQRIAAPRDMLIGANERKPRSISAAQALVRERKHRYGHTAPCGRSNESVLRSAIAVGYEKGKTVTEVVV
jgi:hypothetical protein